MNIKELISKFENDKELKVYLKGINNISDNTDCIINENNKWQVFYYERGTKNALKEFDNEENACKYFEELILKNNERNKEKIKKVIEEYKQQTLKECYTINCVEGQPTVLDDKIGGNPYLPINIEYPKDKNGNYMPLLIQINLKNIDLDDYPKNGILEVFVSKDFDYQVNTLSNILKKD